MTKIQKVLIYGSAALLPSIAVVVAIMNGWITPPGDNGQTQAPASAVVSETGSANVAKVERYYRCAMAWKIRYVAGVSAATGNDDLKAMMIGQLNMGDAWEIVGNTIAASLGANDQEAARDTHLKLQSNMSAYLQGAAANHTAVKDVVAHLPIGTDECQQSLESDAELKKLWNDAMTSAAAKNQGEN